MALLLGSIDGRSGWDRLREIDRGNSSPRQAGRRCSTASWQFAEIDSATALQVDTAGAGAAADTGGCRRAR